MRTLRTLTAILTLKVTDTALTLHNHWTRARSINAETPTGVRLHAAVTWADNDPYLPDRYRDPRDVTDTCNT